MTPTMKLRFVERIISVPIGMNLAEYKTVRVLQQWFVRLTSSGGFLEGKWIDVPLETEE